MQGVLSCIGTSLQTILEVITEHDFIRLPAIHHSMKQRALSFSARFFFTLDTYKAHICGLPNEKKKYHKVKYHYCTYCSILTLIDVTSGFELIRTAVTCRSLESWCKLPELFCDSLFLFAYIPNAQYCKYFVVGEPFGFSLFFFLFDVVVLFPMISIASKIHLSSFINIIADILKFKLY